MFVLFEALQLLRICIRQPTYQGLTKQNLQTLFRKDISSIPEGGINITLFSRTGLLLHGSHIQVLGILADGRPMQQG